MVCTITCKRHNRYDSRKTSVWRWFRHPGELNVRIILHSTPRATELSFASREPTARKESLGSSGRMKIGNDEIPTWYGIRSDIVGFQKKTKFGCTLKGLTQ